jgi:hypothetical protein
MRGHRARARSVIQRQHDNTLSDEANVSNPAGIKRGSGGAVKA